MQSTSAKQEDDVDSEIDFSSVSFILQNLRLANEGLYEDPSSTMASRDYISKSTCLQICFYISLALRSFNRLVLEVRVC
jgi:hypothetical protein